MMDFVDHPSPEQLKAFLDGRLSDEDQRHIEVHVECCQVCCGLLREIEPDSLRGQFGRPHDSDELGRTRDAGSEAEGDSADGELVERRAAERTPRGLHVRCPHCHNLIALVPDAPLVDICCPVCGSWFSLVGDEHASREARSITRVGHFELIDRLGIGAFGSVWKARDTRLDRMVAIKIPRKGPLDGDEAERFFREARAAAQLRHRHIVQVHDADRDGDLLYIVTDLVRGVPLSEKLANQRLTQREVAILLAKVADGLHHAHESKVIHRDLKPQNIMIDADGEPLIMDFGLAKRDAGEITITIEGEPLGTPAYMPPEQVIGDLKQIDRRSDLYSLGVMMFQMLTGELPFRGTRQMVMHQKLGQEPPSPRSLDATIHRDMETICLKCLERDRDRRYATAADVRDDLRRFSEGKPIQARPASPLRRWYANNPVRAKVLVTAFLSMVLITGAALFVAFKLNQSLYRSLISEARALIASAAPTTAVFEILRQALTLPNSDKNEIRKLAVEGMSQHIRSEESLGTFDIGNQPVCLGTSRTGEFVVAGFKLGHCLVYDLASGRLKARSRGDLAEVRAVRLVAGLDEHQHIVQWVSIDGKVYKSLMKIDAPAELVKDLHVGTEYQLKSAKFSGNGEYLTAILVAQTGDDSLPTKNGVWRTQDWTLVDERSVHSESTSSCVADNGDFVAGAYNNDTTNGYFTFRTSTPAELPTNHELDIGAIRREGLCMSSDGKLLVFGCGRSLVFDLSTGQKVVDVQHNEVHMSAISGDKRLAAFCYVDGVIDVIDVDTHRVLATLAQRPQQQRQLDFPALAFSGDNKFLVATNAESLTVWSLDSDRTQLPGHRNGVSSLVYTADGNALISGGHDDVVRISSLISKEHPKEQQCGGAVQCIRLIADRKWLVIGARGGDKPCQILSLETLEPLHDLKAELGPVVGVALTPDGSHLVAAGDNGIGVWQLKVMDDGTIDSTLLDIRKLSASEPRDLNIGAGDIVAWITRHKEELYLHLLDLKANKLVDTTPKVRQLGWHGVQYFPQSGDLAFVNDRGIVERCKPDGTMVARYGEDQLFSSSIIAISHDERFIAGVAEVGRVAIWNTETNTRLFDLPIIGEAWSMAWHPTKHELAIGLSTGQIVRWHLDSIQLRLRELGLDWE